MAASPPPQEEIEEGLRARGGVDDAGLRRELVVLSMPVARAIAGRYRSRGVALEDLEQVAFLALTMAAHRFDAHAGGTFLAFCVPTVRGEVRRYFRDHGWMVRPPRRLQELQREVRRVQAELTPCLGRLPTPGEVADALGEELAAVQEALDCQACFTPVSLDLRRADGHPTLGELVGAEDSAQLPVEARVMLAGPVRRLSERDRHIVRLRFFDDLTQREIADDLGVTQVQVSKLIARILRDLRRDLEAPHITTA